MGSRLKQASVQAIAQACAWSYAPPAPWYNLTTAPFLFDFAHPESPGPIVAMAPADPQAPAPGSGSTTNMVSIWSNTLPAGIDGSMSILLNRNLKLNNCVNEQSSTEKLSSSIFAKLESRESSEAVVAAEFQACMRAFPLGDTVSATGTKLP
jgi:hypothetical protein